MHIHTISFAPDGTARCLWTEAVPLHELGRLEIHRVTDIEFNNATQRWEVKDRRGKVRFSPKSQSACLAWEHEIHRQDVVNSVWALGPGPAHPHRPNENTTTGL
jgi:hypothetical protein